MNINRISEGNNQRNHTRNDKQEMIFKLRNILNIIFILGAIFGMIYYFFIDDYIGTFIILGAMAFKITETSIRLLKI
jgi:VIT1/CCC1 family predicted Fe2+/Mn2+ transporter